MGRAVGAERAGIEFIGIHPVFPDIQHAFRRVPNEIVLIGHRLSQFPEQGEFSPVAGVFGLDRILPAVFTLLYRRKTGGWRPGDL